MAVLLYALSGVARSGATRSDYIRPLFALSVGGVSARTQAIKETVQITDVADDVANTATLSLRAGAVTPVEGQEIIIGLGNVTNRLFAGNIIKVQERRATQAQQYAIYDLSCIDYTWQLDFKRVSAMSFTNVEASTIIGTMVSAFAPTFSTARVSSGMGSIDFQSNDEELLSSAITRVMQKVGGYWYVDYDRVVHGFQSYETDNAPTALTSSNNNFGLLSHAIDISQVRTRTRVKGGSSTTTAPVAVAATSIPVDDTRLFASGGGMALTGANRITYTGKSVGDGPGNLTGVPASGAGSVAVAIAQGESVRVQQVASDASAAADMATLLGSGDGYIEHVIEDGNAGDAAALEIAEGDIAVYKTPDETLVYETRDKFAKSGKAVSVNVTHADTGRVISGSFLIQQVVISEIELVASRQPKRVVTAGTNRRDLYDLLRKLAS